MADLLYGCFEVFLDCLLEAFFEYLFALMHSLSTK
jgi:hypothetical protein